LASFETRARARSSAWTQIAGMEQGFLSKLVMPGLVPGIHVLAPL
jgi:hypothetical protein